MYNFKKKNINHKMAAAALLTDPSQKSNPIGVLQSLPYTLAFR